MTENEAINSWTFEETIKNTENLMEAESNMFVWDVLRHLRDFVENYREEVQQCREIGTVEEFRVLKEKSVPKKVINARKLYYGDCPICGIEIEKPWVYCYKCGQRVDWSEPFKRLECD